MTTSGSAVWREPGSSSKLPLTRSRRTRSGARTPRRTSAKPGVRASKWALGPECSPCVSVPSGWLWPRSCARCGSCLPGPTRQSHVIAVRTHARANARPSAVSPGPGTSVSERCTTRGILTPTMSWMISTNAISAPTRHPMPLPRPTPMFPILTARHRGCAFAAPPILVSID